MPTERRRYTVQPDERAVAIVGGDGTSISLAVEAMAGLVRRATPADLAREDWNFLLGSFAGTAIDGRWSRELLVAHTEDSLAMEPANAEMHYGSMPGRKGKALLARLRALDEVGAWAILFAVRWAWEHADDLDLGKDEWWLPEFRVRG